MEKKEMVIKILKESGTLTAKQISAFAKRKYDFDDVPKESDLWGDLQYIDVDQVDKHVWKPFVSLERITDAKERLKATYPDDYV